MPKNKGWYLFVLSYVMSFVCLVFEYIRQRPDANRLILDVQDTIAMSNHSRNLLLFFAAVIMALLTYMIYHYVLLWGLRKMSTTPISDEYLAISLLASEGLCNIIALSVLYFLADSIIQMLLPVIGLSSFYYFLRNHYTTAQVKRLLLVRTIFYMSNLLVVVCGLIG